VIIALLQLLDVVFFFLLIVDYDDKDALAELDCFLIVEMMFWQSREVRSIMKTTGIWWSDPEGLVQNRTARFTTDRRRHLMSLITMLGPSPDWCVGEFFARISS